MNKRKIVCLLCLLLVLCVGFFTACANQGGAENETVQITFRQEGYEDTVLTVQKGEALADVPKPMQVYGYQSVQWDIQDFSAFYEDTVVTAVMKPKQYTVTLNLDGGEVTDSQLPVENGTIVMDYGAQYTLPTVKKAGYALEGWYCDGLYIAKEGVWEYTYVTTLTAKWREAKTEIPDLVDFVLQVPSGRDVRILQLTDTQIIDAGQARSKERLGDTTPLTEETLEIHCFRYIKAAIEATDPDLILLTGDLVYGEFDDSGKMFKRLISYMESFRIPWAPIFGNHDNESAMGVTWQCEQLEQAKYCLFKRGDVTGNGNYSIGIVQDDKLIKTIFMMDSNGCTNAYKDGYGAKDKNGNVLTYNEGEKIKTDIGFGYDQISWLKEKCTDIDTAMPYTVSKFIAFHIPITQFAMGAYESGYQSTFAPENDDKYTIGKDVTAQNGDFGTKGEAFKGIHTEAGLWNILKSHHFDGVFCGHSHKNSVSILYDGIRLTFGLKTGTFDRYSTLGGTLITLNQNEFTVEHIPYK